MSIRNDTVRDLISHLQHYGEVTCEHCERQLVLENMIDVTINIKKLVDGDRMVGTVWWECPVCLDMVSSDFWIR